MTRAWRVAESLEVLRRQINAKFPGRSLAADGGIGDAAHASRNSDHNPFVVYKGVGIVRARDFTHDPLHGLDAGKLAEVIRASADPRVNYIISNGRIANSGKPWRKYSGPNPHNKHFHVSVSTDPKLFDDATLWKIDSVPVLIVAEAPKVIELPLLKQGSEGEIVKELQKLLGFKNTDVDGYFGPKTKAKVAEFQKKSKLSADGIVGFYTWQALKS